MFRAMLVAGALLAGAAAVVWVARPSSGGTGTAAMSPGEISADEAAQFEGYPLLWVGDSFDGLPLTAVIRDLRSDEPGSPVPTARDGFFFI